jgi:hypothetical protein
MERAEEARKDMQTLCGGWGSSGETQNRAGAGFHVDGFRHSGYGRRNPPYVNAWRSRAYTLSSP